MDRLNTAPRKDILEPLSAVRVIIRFQTLLARLDILLSRGIRVQLRK